LGEGGKIKKFKGKILIFKKKKLKHFSKFCEGNIVPWGAGVPPRGHVVPPVAIER
jgi:hypothetical protein